MLKHFILSSGGVDSTTLLAYLVDKYGSKDVIILNLHYGQRNEIECECSKKVREYYGVLKFISRDLSQVFSGFANSLIDKKKELKEETYTKQFEQGKIIDTYVPFRNGLFLSCAASIAFDIVSKSNDRGIIYLASHLDDFAYPDCSAEFIKAMEMAIGIGTNGFVSVLNPFAHKTKKEIISLGLKIHVPYQLTYSCYEGRKKPCGKCASCLDRLRAFEENGVKDPVEYEIQ